MLDELIRRLLRCDGGRAARLDSAVDMVVAQTDARIGLLPGYRKALLPGVRRSIDYVSALSAQLPGCLDLSLRNFTLDRRLGLFFSSPSSLLTLLERSEPLQDFFLAAANGDDAYALLLMQRTDTLRYGMAADDEGEVHSDVAQTVVSFDRHRVILPCQSVELLHQRSVQRGLDVLTQVVGRRLQALSQERSSLELELTRIRLRLSALTNPDAHLIDALPGDDALPQDAAGLAARRDLLQQRLQEVRSVTELNGLLELVAHMLLHPEDYFRVELATINLDRMGVLQPAGDDDITPVCVEELLLSHDAPLHRVMMPVHVNRPAIDELRRCVAAGQP